MPFCPAGTRVSDSTSCTARAGDQVTGSNKLTGEVRKQGNGEEDCPSVLMAAPLALGTSASHCC